MELAHDRRSRLNVQLHSELLILFLRTGKRDTFKLLKQTIQRVAELNEGEVSPKTNSGPMVEGDILPLTRLPAVPSIWPERPDIWASYISIAMERDH